ncbi:hypothetical protein H6F53_19275 [Trichocoleus sp. FACHB-832]|nr:hypothetical protein [Trichocoleus sp. FACHB-832]
MRTLQLVEGRDNPDFTCLGCFHFGVAALPGSTGTFVARTHSKTAKSLSPQFFSLGNLVNCPTQRMVGLSLPASPWNAHSG